MANGFFFFFFLLELCRCQTILTSQSCNDGNLCEPVLPCDTSFAMLKPFCRSWWRNDRCYAETNEDSVVKRAEKLFEAIRGQNHATQTMLARLSQILDPQFRQRHFHFAGDNGVGKTYMAQLVSAALSLTKSEVPHSGSVLYQVDTQPAQFTSSDTGLSERIAIAIRNMTRQIEIALVDCPRAVILVDELHRLYPDTVASFSKVIKGELMGNGRIPTKSAVLIFTSDFGNQSRAKGWNREQIKFVAREEAARLHVDAGKDVEIVPFVSPGRPEYTEIYRELIRKLPCKKAIIKCVQWNELAENKLVDYTMMITAKLPENYTLTNARYATNVFQNQIVDKVLKTSSDRVIVKIIGEAGMTLPKIEIVPYSKKEEL